MATATSLGAGGVQNAYDSVAAGTTDSVLIAGVAGRRIRVLTYMINQGDTTPSAVTFNTKPSGSGTAIWPAIKYAANGGTNPPFNERGWFSTNKGDGLTVTTGAGSTTGVAVVYDLIS